ncbi:MAG: hypothetical protein UY89_C0001G0012 [Parcubacteria group bacterium GW2011_GWA1_54_9]|nr:MAG: hypothetical protein UY89_C0001G0012 [Parcubacteria group bacterium GW2011_GWA1_54_9]KKW42649.1 MAG: hypothetical protein UY91_C0002G0015 [Parcubacteria group bacterium GW2011_GWB1_55_9]
MRFGASDARGTMGVMGFLRAHKVEVGIFVLALLVRLFYFGLSLEVNNGNITNTVAAADGYFTVSQNLIDGHGLSSDATPPYTPYSFRPPLFHFFIAGAYALFGSYWGVIFLQIVLASLLPLLGMRLAGYFIENRRILIALGIFLALEPSSILYSVFLYSEIFFTLWLYAAIWALFAYLKKDQSRYLALSAFLLGLATLTRPTTEYVPVVMGAVLLWNHRGSIFSRKILVDVGVYAAVFLLTIAPWVYRNYVVFGVAGISPQTGVNLYTQLLPTVYSIERGTTFQEEYKALIAAGVHGPNEADITEGRKDTAIAVPLLLDHPKGLTLSILNSGWNFFVLDGTFNFLRHIQIRPEEMIGKPSLVALFSDPAAVSAYILRNLNSPVIFSILLARAMWVSITILFLLGVWRYGKSRGMSSHATVALLIVLYFAATSLLSGFGLTARYRLPVNVFIITFAFYEIAAIAPRLFQKVKRLHAS